MKVIETTAAIYLRKSTEGDGKSVAAQERQLRTKADQLGIDIAAVYRNDDGTSASSFLITTALVRPVPGRLQGWHLHDHHGLGYRSLASVGRGRLEPVYSSAPRGCDTSP